MLAVKERDSSWHTIHDISTLKPNGCRWVRRDKRTRDPTLQQTAIKERDEKIGTAEFSLKRIK